MTKRTKEIIIVSSGIFVQLISAVAYKAFNLNYLMAMNILTIYVVIFFIYNIVNRDNDIEVNKNNVAFLYGMLIQYISLAGCIMENYVNNISDSIFYVFVVITIISSIINNAVISNNPRSKKYRYISLGTCMSIYLILVLSIENFWCLFIGIPLMVAYTVYQDKRLRIILCIILTIINLCGCVKQIITYYKGDSYIIWLYLLEIFAIFIFTMSFSRTSKIIYKLNEDNLSEINQKKAETLKLSNNVIEVSKSVKECANETTDLINSIDNVTDKSLKIFTEIGNDNIENANSVEQQSKMTGAIVNMINEVLDATNNASSASSVASNTLIKNKESFGGIKKMSNNIVDYNEKLVKVIDNFVLSVNKVKNIINGISDISEQIDLLALNASIESARAGEVGKEFSVVAIEIKSLSEETTELTNEINKVIALLGKNAAKVQKVVSDVVEEIKEENLTIDETEKDFNVIEEDVKNLSRYIIEIVNRVKNVVEFSNNIEKHIDQLAATSQEVTACTEEAVLLNKNNKEKVSKTSNMMKEMLDVIGEFNQYITS